MESIIANRTTSAYPWYACIPTSVSVDEWRMSWRASPSGGYGGTLSYSFLSQDGLWGRSRLELFTSQISSTSSLNSKTTLKYYDLHQLHEETLIKRECCSSYRIDSRWGLRIHHVAFSVRIQCSHSVFAFSVRIQCSHSVFAFSVRI